jgi:hypothetical protein
MGGIELKAGEMAQISQQDVLIGDAVLDAIFNSWAWGPNIAMLDKVEDTLNICKLNKLEVDMDAFVSAALPFRDTQQQDPPLTFITIQLVFFGTLFVEPAIRFLKKIDIGLESLGSK